MGVASVKGSILAGAVDDVVRLRDEGRVTPELLELRLEPRDIELLATKLNPAEWYPMASYGRLLALLGEAEGGSRDAYFRERGRANARRLMDAGLYQQLSFIERWTESLPKGRAEGADLVWGFLKNLRLVVTLAKSIYSVGAWNAEPDPESERRVVIDVREAADYSEPMRLAAEGFLNQSGNLGFDLFSSQRVEPALIRFRMTVDVADLR